MSRDTSIENAKKMREEIITFDQFNTIGSPSDVALRYGVSVMTAYTFRKSLGSGSVKADNNSEHSESQEMPIEGTERCVERLNGKSIDECAEAGKVEPENANMEQEEIRQMTDYPERYEQLETIDDLDGLVEPEPVWGNDSAEDEISVLQDGLKRKRQEAISNMCIDTMWEVVKGDMDIIRRIQAIQSDREFKSRLMKFVEAI